MMITFMPLFWSLKNKQVTDKVFYNMVLYLASHKREMGFVAAKEQSFAICQLLITQDPVK